MIKTYNGDNCHELLTKKTVGKLAFDESRDYPQWKAAVGEKLRELLGLDMIAENACPVTVDMEETEEFDTYRRLRFTYESETGNHVPAYLLIPKGGEGPYPLAIALQGHSTGFHNAIGIVKYDWDKTYQPNGSYGVQAVEHGFATLCIEQRGMGETRSPRYPGPGGVHACSFTAMTALNLGRTILGERIWDVSRGIDALQQMALPEIDLSKIMAFGNSGGGTAAFYAACFEPRIGFVVPSCAFCSYKASIMDILHCVCNHIPKSSLWFEMEDLACLIAPRKLTVLTGSQDDIFPLEGVKASYQTAEKIYAKEHASENCRLVVTPKAHYWYQPDAWAAIHEGAADLGWKTGV